MLDDLLPAAFQPIAFAALGLLAGIVGLTGLLRRETSALNPAEPSTALGRALTPVISALWLLVSPLFLLSLLLPAPLREDLIGLTSVVVALLYVLFLLLTLVVSIFTRKPLPKPETVRVMESAGRELVSAFSEPRFQRLDTVMHPDYGQGRILAIYRVRGRKIVAVRFSNVVRSIPAISVSLHSPEAAAPSLSALKIEIEQLEYLLAALEAQRSTLGIQALEVGIKPLRDKLVSLIFTLEQESLADTLTVEEPLQAQINNLQEILAELETQRHKLGNQALEIGMKPLRDRLVALIFAREQEVLAEQILSKRGPLQEQIDDLEELLATLESQRETLGDQAMEISMKPLRDKLVALIFAREQSGSDMPH